MDQAVAWLHPKYQISLRTLPQLLNLQGHFRHTYPPARLSFSAFLFSFFFLFRSARLSPCRSNTFTMQAKHKYTPSIPRVLSQTPGDGRHFRILNTNMGIHNCGNYVTYQLCRDHSVSLFFRFYWHSATLEIAIGQSQHPTQPFCDCVAPNWIGSACVTVGHKTDVRGPSWSRPLCLVQRQASLVY